MSRKPGSGEEGIVLFVLSAFISAGMIAYLVYNDASIFSKKEQQHASLTADRQALLEYFQRQVSCAYSYSDLTCPSSTFVPLYKNYNGSKKTIVEPTGTKFGNWTVRAECSPNNKGLVVRAVRLKAGGTVNSTDTAQFLPDPLTQTTYTWNSPLALLQPSPQTICPKTSSKGFPKPDFDSGWVTVPATIQHGLGTNSFDYVTYCRDGSNVFLCWTNNTFAYGAANGFINAMAYSYITLTARDASSISIDKGGWYRSYSYNLNVHDYKYYSKADEARVLLWKVNL